VGPFILLAAVALGIFGIGSGNTQFVWFGAVLALYAIGSSFLLSLEDTAGHRRRAVTVLGWFQLLAIALGIGGLAFNNIQLLLLAVAVLVAVIGTTLVASLRDAKQRRAQLIQGIGAHDHPEK
jgi:hypothetical protein